ncbi:Fibronectin type III domain [Mycoplasmopsis canis]|uniref:Fibronectin type III domain n=1 Tax=Mycoplasmopsis canis TaxID=29555 RepID=A0A449AQ67_9BACT|nr:hypothetical protein [Mycoplasmopsis canis]VEU68641.1 Fibronectin type III domain [Mycoplasmopsis canis]
MAGSIVATGVILSQVNSKKKNDEPKTGNEPKFEPVVKLTDSKFDELSFEVSNLNAAQNKGKEFIAVLTNKRDFTIRNEKAITIDGDSTNIKFDSLESDRKYNLSILFKGKIVLKDVFTTKKRPAISAGTPSATNASFVISNINDFKDELEKVQIVITNKTNPSSAPIVIKASDLKVSNGSAIINLQEENLGLEPGSTYEAVVQFNGDKEKTNLSTPIVIETPVPKNIAYTSHISKEGVKIVLYGLKEDGKKIKLEYRLRGFNGDHTEVESIDNVTGGKAEVLISGDLGLDNTYEFQVKYEDGEYLTFEDESKKGEFKTEAAPSFEVQNKNDSLDISISKLSPNINQDNLFIRYRDKENSNEWIEKPIKEVPGFSEGKLNFEDLASDTNYEAQLIYKQGEGENASTKILTEAEFRTSKYFVFDITKSIAASTKVLLSFKDNSNSTSSDLGVTLKYVKDGEADLKTATLSKKSLSSSNYVQSVISDLEKSTTYNWTLISNKDESVIASGTFKTGTDTDVAKSADNSNFYETNESDVIAIENRLTEGVVVSVKNTFGYITGDGAEKYSPTEILIKYYPKDSESEYETERIVVSSQDIKNKKFFTKKFEDFAETPYIFEVSYLNGFNENNEEIKVLKKFEISYKLPVIEFKNSEKKLVVSNLESIAGKTVTLKYKANDGEREEEELSVSGTVSANGLLEIPLSNLRSNVEYNAKFEILSNDIEFNSSITGFTRSQFYDNEILNNNLVLSDVFRTEEQENSIRIKHVRPNFYTQMTSIYVLLEGFVAEANQQVNIVIGSEEEMKNPSSIPDERKTVGTVNASGVVDSPEGAKWWDNLPSSTNYKIGVFKVDDDNWNKIAERDFSTPVINKPNIQRLEIIGSNTHDFGFRVENLQELKDLYGNNASVVFRVKRIDEEIISDSFSGSIKEINDPNGWSGIYRWTKRLSDNFGKQGDVIRIKNFTGASDSNWTQWFVDKSKYQIILTIENSSNHYIIASNQGSDLILVNHSSPRINDSETTNISKISDKDAKKVVGKVEYKLTSLSEYISTNESPQILKAFYIKSNDPLASSNPSNWISAGNVLVNDADQTGQISFDNLELNTFYNFAFLGKDNNIVLTRENVKTANNPKLKITTSGDTIMRYTLSELKGSQNLIPNGTYKIIYSTDKSYNLSSNEITINESTNLQSFEGNFVFTLLEGLVPNTTYNYKLVNIANNDVLLGYDDIFKTNKSQSEETVIGNDFAIIKLINPSYELREGSYSIAKKGQGADENKMVLDVIRMQYSEDPNFVEGEYKEFSVSLSENEVNLLSIKLQDLKPGTQYYYRLVKGTIKSNIIQASSVVEEPVVELNTTLPLLSGNFTTWNTKFKVESTTNSSRIIFEDINNITGPNQLSLNFKKVDKSNIYDILFDYSIVDGKVIFEVNNLSPETEYEFSLSPAGSQDKIANGKFLTKTTSTIEARMIKIDEPHRRIKLTNLEDFVGRKIRIEYKEKNSTKILESINTVLTNENDEFLWDIEDLEFKKEYKYDVYLLNEDNSVDRIIDTKEFEVGPKYTSAGDQTVTTNVRTFGNYDLNSWYTITTLQEIYANHKNWKDKVKESLIEIAIFGTQVSAGPAYGWHKLISEGSNHRYYKEENGNLVYEYIFVDTANQPVGSENAKVKGIKFMLQLLGNTIQVKIIEAKVKPEVVDKRVVVSNYSWSDLTDDLVYGATSGVVNQGNGDIPGRYINLSGFKFKASTAKRSPRDFSVPQIFRYNLESAKIATNKFTVSKGNSTTGSFIKLNNAKQKIKYGNLDENYDVAYNKYISENGKLLPFTGNFLINASIYPHSDFAKNDKNIYTPGIEYGPNLRETFFRLLKENGKIKFDGSDVSNKNWISLNSEDIIMFEDEFNAYSEKYLTEFPLAKRLIWKDGNQLKGLRITLSDAENGDGAVLGQLDDFVYYLDINSNQNIKSITWDQFITLASKHSVHKYMNLNSNGTAIAGIGFVTKDKSFIANSNSTNTFTNPQDTQPITELESVSGEESTTRKIKLINAPIGTYQLKVEYPIYFPTPEKPTFEPIIETFEITKENSNYFEKDLTQYLQYGTEYKVTISKGEIEYKVLTGINGDISGGQTFFANNSIKSATMGIYNVSGRPGVVNDGDVFYYPNPDTGQNNWRVSFNAREFLNMNPNSDEAFEILKTREKRLLIGSPRLANGEMRYKWSFKTDFFASRKSNATHKHVFFTAAVSDDETKAIILRIVLYRQVGSNNVTVFVAGAKEYALNENERNNLNSLNLTTAYNNGTNIKDDVVTSNDLSEDYFVNQNENKVAVFGFYIKKETN